ncbi:MAG: hypothetical protein L3J39_19415 [Verrucomicrobiales bacterium]|nr:hypothetical protein [Verrucomicrobiales bacterium]
MNTDTTVIGYFAVSKRGDVVCDGAACIIAGSYKAMKGYLEKSETKPPAKVKIIKTRLGEILSGMRRGGVYSFDEQAYGGFLPLAREKGMGFESLDFTPDKPGDIKFLTIAQTIR